MEKSNFQKHGVTHVETVWKKKCCQLHRRMSPWGAIRKKRNSPPTMITSKCKWFFYGYKASKSNSTKRHGFSI